MKLTDYNNNIISTYNYTFIPQLVKDIRRLVDNGEFLSSKHAKSPVVKLMVTLLLELITDHSREVTLE